MDAAKLAVEGQSLLQRVKQAFQELPEECPLRQPAQLRNGLRVDDWLGLLEHVLQQGVPEVIAPGARFALDVYGLDATLEMEGQDVQVHSMASEPTFFGNYAPPDDLDGQIIDLVATRSSACLRLQPRALHFGEDLARHAEVRAWQQQRCDTSTVCSLGVVPQEYATSTKGIDVHLSLPCGGEVRKRPHEKVVLSDHIPIAFTARWEGDGTEHELFVMSMNMLAQSYLDFNFWNACPQGDTQELWQMASRLRATADRKTKWLPQEYSTLGRIPGMSDEELMAAKDCPSVHWERLHRELWRWIFRVQREASRAQVAGNIMASDAVRQGVLVQLLMAGNEAERPDLVVLQEFGLEELSTADLPRLQESLSERRPLLRPLLQCYQVVHLSPKLAVRRDWKSSFTDTGLLLVKKSLLEKYKFQPLAASGELDQIYAANAGKPIVGAQMQDLKTGRPLANIFGVHAEKAKTAGILRSIFEFSASLGDVPTLVVGDFNAVLRASEASSAASFRPAVWNWLSSLGLGVATPLECSPESVRAH